MTHSSPPGERSSSRWMDGRATFTMVTSSRIMAWARHIATSVRPVLPARSRLTVAFWRDLGSGHEPRAVAHLVTRSRVDADGLEAISRPRTDLLLERDCGGGRFEA